jgi:hypothetical protein
MYFPSNTNTMIKQRWVRLATLIACAERTYTGLMRKPEGMKPV